MAKPLLFCHLYPCNRYAYFILLAGIDLSHAASDSEAEYKRSAYFILFTSGFILYTFHHRYAASKGHNAILKLLLLQPGVDINTPDRFYKQLEIDI